MPFLPQGVEPPKSNSLYFRFEQGDNKFRILSDAIVGWVDWTAEKKPIRSKEQQQAIDATKQPKNFWAFKVWDYKEHKLKILEITQTGIQSSIFDLFKSDSWGDPKGYDLTVKREGTGIETKYNVVPTPPMPANPEIIKILNGTDCDLEQLFVEGGDPFCPKGFKGELVQRTQPPVAPLDASVATKVESADSSNINNAQPVQGNLEAPAPEFEQVESKEEISTEDINSIPF